MLSGKHLMLCSNPLLPVNSESHLGLELEDNSSSSPRTTTTSGGGPVVSSKRQPLQAHQAAVRLGPTGGLFRVVKEGER
jgi:hypothetical protein